MLYAMPALAQPAQSKPERFAGIAVVAGIHLALLVAVVIGIGPRVFLPPEKHDVTIYPSDPKPPVDKPQPMPFAPVFQDPVVTLPKPPDVDIRSIPPVTDVAPPTIPTGPVTPGAVTSTSSTTGVSTSVGVACPNSRSVRDAVGYPIPAIREGIQGDVLVRFVVSTSGQIRDIAIAQSSNRIFNSAAMAAVREFQCVAQARDVQVEVPFSFRLQ